MSDEKALVPEVVPPPSRRAAAGDKRWAHGVNDGRDPKTGKFTKDQTLVAQGRTPGSLNKVNKAMKLALAESIASGGKKHPAEVLLDLANDTNAPPGIRRAAAADLLPYLWPKKAIELEPPDQDDALEARIAGVRKTVARLFLAEFVDEKLPG